MRRAVAVLVLVAALGSATGPATAVGPETGPATPMETTTMADSAIESNETAAAVSKVNSNNSDRGLSGVVAVVGALVVFAVVRRWS
jgi:hypothetical protein